MFFLCIGIIVDKVRLTKIIKNMFYSMNFGWI